MLQELTEPKQVCEATSRMNRTLAAACNEADLDKITSLCAHSSLNEQDSLNKLLKKHEPLFDGASGAWNIAPVSLELKPGSEPHHGRVCPTPQAHDQSLRDEVQRPTKLGVLEQIDRSEWAAPSFPRPEQNNTIRFISDFRKLNECLMRHPFPIPHVPEPLQKLQGFTCASSLDLNMGCCHARLDADACELCTIVPPWGKHEHQRLPVGVACSADIFQEKMSELVHGLEFAQVCMDDLSVLMKKQLRGSSKQA